MEISKQQLKSILQKAPMGTDKRDILEGLINKGYTIEGIDPTTSAVFRAQSQQQEALSGNQFEQPESKSLWEKARNFASSIVGGGKLAEGVGQTLAAPEVRRSLDEAYTTLTNQQSDLLNQYREATKNGEDTSKLEKLMQLNSFELEKLADTNKDYAESLPSDKQVIGSATRLGATALVPGVASRMSKLFGVGGATTVKGGLARGLGAGATTGALEGAVQGGGIAAEQESDIATGAVTGGVIGAATGGLIGTVAGGITGLKNPKTFQQKLQNITPDASEISPSQYQEFLTRGRIEPRTATSPAKFVFSKRESTTLNKFSKLIEKDPARTAINFADEVSRLDDEVGSFLKQNNSIFNSGELRNSIRQSMDEISNITIPEQQLNTAKDKLIDAFVNKLDKNNMENLWVARKEFDRKIQKAFSGSPSLQKSVKRSLRNAVQDFISERTPDDVYKGYMNDMRGLIDVNDLITLKASKQRARSAIMQWIKENPKKSKAIGWGTGLIVANKILNPFGGSGGE